MRISDWSSDVCSSDLCTCDTRGTSVAGKARSIASGPWCPAGTVPMRPAPWRIDAGAVRSARGLRRLQRAVTLQRLLQVAAQRRAVLRLLFEDGLLAQQVEMGRASCGERGCQTV